MFASWNMFFAKGYTANDNKQADTAVRQDSTHQHNGKYRSFAPTSRTIVFAIDAASPAISTTFQNSTEQKHWKYSLIKPASSP